MARGRISQPKDATKTTRAANAAVRKALPFDDMRDFDDVNRGLVALLPDGGVIRDAAGRVVWDLSKFGFVMGSESPDTVNPSLWRQAQLMAVGGLFQVTDRLYQVRSADLSNMDIIEGETGLIIVDPLISSECAKAGLDLYYAHRPRKPVVAVIHTHSHVDHWGGVMGVISAKDVQAGRVKVYAPAGYTEEALSENLFAGTAMARRTSYFAGNLIPPGPKGTAGSGLGLSTSSGTIMFAAPTDEITKPVQHVTIDGLRFVFMLAPDTEAPAEMLFHIPALRALCAAEDATHTLHQTYTLRGAKTRDPKAWAHYLNKAIELFADHSDVVFAQHHWPTWGTDDVVEYLEAQRDAYKFLNDQTLHLINKGHTAAEIAEMLEFPAELRQLWHLRGYYGTVNHDARSVYNFYMGWFDMNPAHLHPLPPAEESKRYVQYMGGADKVLAKARRDFKKGEYRWVAQAVNHVVFADPSNQRARDLLADAFEQLGYQAEAGTWRNIYLTGAQELRDGIKKVAAPTAVSPEQLAVLPLQMIFDYLGIMLDGRKAAGKSIKINLDLTDTHEQYLLQLRNSVFNYFEGQQAKDADLTLRLSRAQFGALLARPQSVPDALKTGKVRTEGNPRALADLAKLLDTFDFWFNIIEP